MSDIRTVVMEGLASGIAARYNRDPVVERLLSNELEGQNDQRVMDVTEQMTEKRRFYDGERKQLIDDGNAPDSHVVTKLEEERDLVLEVLSARLKRFKQASTR